MLRLYIAAVVILIIVCGIAYYVIFGKNTSQTIKSLPAQILNTQQTTPVDISIREQIDLLEKEIQSLKSQVSSSPAPIQKSTTSTSSLETRLNTLETTISTLQTRVNSLSGGSSSVSTSGKSTIFIPLGAGGSSSKNEWTVSDTMQIDLDPANYPGYTSMVLEVRLNVKDGNGRAYARLYNSTDGTAILSSEVSTTNYLANWVSSSTFTLPSGKKTYKFQLKTLTTGYDSIVTDSRIRVNF